MALSGKTMVFTGTLSMKRVEATKLATSSGAKVTTSVSKSTNIIVCGPDAINTTKVLTAKALGTSIWTEDEFKKAVEGKAKAAAKAAPRGRAPPKAKSADKEISAKDQHTFLDHAKNKEFDKVKKLVELNSGYVNVQPAQRWSALHQAAEAGDKDVLKFLLDHSADVSVKTKDGKTALDVAKVSVHDLLKKAALKAPAKRKAPAAGPPAKRATPATGPKLHLYKAMSAQTLSDEMGEWMVGGDDDTSLVKDDVQHAGMASAPAAAKTIADKLNEALDEGTLPGGETDCTGMVIVISNAGDDPKEACLQALAIDQDIAASGGENLADCADCTDTDYSSVKMFCYDDDDIDEEEEDDDHEKIKKTTGLMGKMLKDTFYFNFNEQVVVAPQVWGGYTKDKKSIVGVLGVRVWT